MDIRNYTSFFHDGSLFSIKHIGTTITMRMGSAEMDKEDIVDDLILTSDEFIHGKFHIENVSAIRENDNLITNKLRMKSQEGDIFGWTIKGNKNRIEIEFQVIWDLFNSSKKNNFSVITIQAEHIWWENLPQQKVTITTSEIEIDFPTEERLEGYLKTVLQEIENPETYHWALSIFDGYPVKSSDLKDFDRDKEVNYNPNVFTLSWGDFKALMSRFSEIYHLELMGSKDPQTLHRCKNEEEMKAACDIVIKQSMWAFFGISSKESSLIKKITKKLNL